VVAGFFFVFGWLWAYAGLRLRRRRLHSSMAAQRKRSFSQKIRAPMKFKLKTRPQKNPFNSQIQALAIVS
jgi:hypothetical protein